MRGGAFFSPGAQADVVKDFSEGIWYFDQWLAPNQDTFDKVVQELERKKIPIRFPIYAPYCEYRDAAVALGGFRDRVRKHVAMLTRDSLLAYLKVLPQLDMKREKTDGQIRIGLIAPVISYTKSWDLQP